MTENINNTINSSYKYINSELSKYDTDQDGSLSIFELENIQDEEGIQVLNQDINSQIQCSQTNECNIDTQIEALTSKLNDVKNEQGAISSAWNSLKCLTGIGSSTKKCEQAIQDFKNGKITYEEADNIISEFSTKQKNSVNFVANIATGIAAVAVVASAVATGGLSLGIIAAGAAVGAATKAGIKFADRATNKVEGDALDAKQIAKDALSGAVDGGVSVATMGIGSAAVTGKTVAEQTIKQTVIQGAASGAKAGAISGAVTGAADYSIEAAFEEDVDFNLKDLAANTAMTAAGGAVAGGIMGVVSSGLQYKKAEIKLDARCKEHPKVDKKTIAELSDQAQKINSKYESKIDEATQQVKDVFGKDNPENIITGRAKSENSIFAKLVNKFEKNQISSSADDVCFDAIGDGLGTRVQIKSLSNNEAKEIIENALDGSGISYNDFIKYLDGDTSGLDNTALDYLKKSGTFILDELKEKQTEGVLKNLIQGIEDGSITITELNNYGDEISSYFTFSQLQKIADSYNKVNPGQKLDIVTWLDETNIQPSPNIKYGNNNETITDTKTKLVETDTAKYTTKGAKKDSGYTSSQMNTVHKFEDGTTGLGELQIRGQEVNNFADIEHIPYDIRKGKITAGDTKYAKIYDTIKSMTDSTYESYNTYLTKVYNWLRLKELGIETTEPVLKNILVNSNLSDEALEMLSREGLTAISNAAH